MQNKPAQNPEQTNEQAIYIHGTESEEQERLRLLNRLTNPAFIDFLNINRSIKVLDVGCGLGILASELARQYPNCEIHGVEFSAEQLQEAQHNLPNVFLLQGDAHELPYEAHTFDVVYCRYLLEHVKSPLKVLQEMYRVLKPYGRAFVQENNIAMTVYDPDCPKFEELWNKFIALQTILGGDGLIGKKLYRLFREAGFKQIDLSIAPQAHGFEDVYFDDWMVNIIGNVESARQKLIEYNIADTPEINNAIQELNRLRKNPNASTIFYWNRATGIKKYKPRAK